MALKEAWRVVTGDPQGSSAWSDNGGPSIFAAATATTTANGPAGYSGNPAIFVVPQRDAFLADGSNPGSSTTTSMDPLMRLMGAQVSFATALAPNTSLTFGLRVLRQYGTLSAAFTNGTTYTTLGIKSPGLLTTMITAQSFSVTNQSAALDTVVSSATNGPITTGTTSMGIVSQNPSNTAAIGDPVYGFVGATAPTGYTAANGIVCGYIGTGATGGGTPLLPVGASITLPIISTAFGVVTPVTGSSYFPLYSGDVIEFVGAVASSTQAVPAFTIQPLIA